MKTRALRPASPRLVFGGVTNRPNKKTLSDSTDVGCTVSRELMMCDNFFNKVILHTETSPYLLALQVVLSLFGVAIFKG